MASQGSFTRSNPATITWGAGSVEARLARNKELPQGRDELLAILRGAA